MNFAVIFTFIISAYANTHLLLVGGGHRPTKALEKLVHHSSERLILIIPWASENLAGAENISNELKTIGAINVKVAPQFPLNPAKLATFQIDLQTAGAIFFTGGDQNKLMRAIFELQLKESFKILFKKGIVFAGTSAGTAVMSETMLTGIGSLNVIDGSQIITAEGLGLLPSHIIVDQHFIIRSRFNRLAGLILGSSKSGLAIDENNALWVENEKANVIGPTQVLFFKSSNPQKLEIGVYRNGDAFSI